MRFGGFNLKFKVVYDVTKIEEEIIDAASFDEAESIWLNKGMDARLYCIKDENGKEVIYD